MPHLRIQPVLISDGPPVVAARRHPVVGVHPVVTMLVHHLPMDGEPRRLPPGLLGSPRLIHQVLDGVQPLGHLVQRVGDPQELVSFQGLLLVGEQHQPDHVANGEVNAA